ncbi:RsmE family RNA methyltransferase [Dinghuibacter silviterrae]|uniref:Ribosomal RNA small subunit methyltransferase E n=1 Tax=Dinghuibacter silviterrae TaxID=1539049 RepID=A0A4R8DSU0_9BACT|nr:16S rRNA (uracil(1498)-N(3))-methyltransferase [Dinghuibacter silviterrae]TDX00221.1 16S rRNA (uracil1498-N3)-methyltransferase [Dinghuibacter silviterrae]
MSLPFFYAPGLTATNRVTDLDEPTSRHCVQVLRMRTGDRLILTDGRGLRVEARLLEADKRRSSVALEAPVQHPRTGPDVYIGISPVKNTSRFEWFLEKATEIGVAGIIPLLCERTERSALRLDRLEHILVSAMLQSQQVWLPELREPQVFSGVLATAGGVRYIAHCEEGEKRTLALGGATGAGADVGQAAESTAAGTADDKAATLLIGPEGDFTPNEVTEALSRGWIPVTLGDTRLRTETAGIVGATLLRWAAR